MSMLPTKIIVLRHAEKPREGNDQGLSQVGEKRADYIAQFIPKNLGIPNYIFATLPTKESLRPALTVLPLWESLRDHEEVMLDVTIPDDHAQHLGHHLVTDDRWAMENILVCWHHGKIPELLKGIGLEKDSYPDPWPENDYGTVLVVTFANGKPILSQYKMLF